METNQFIFWTRDILYPYSSVEERKNDFWEWWNSQENGYESSKFIDDGRDHRTKPIWANTRFTDFGARLQTRRMSYTTTPEDDNK